MRPEYGPKFVAQAGSELHVPSLHLVCPVGQTAFWQEPSKHINPLLQVLCWNAQSSPIWLPQPSPASHILFLLLERGPPFVAQRRSELHVLSLHIFKPSSH